MQENNIVKDEPAKKQEIESIASTPNSPECQCEKSEGESKKCRYCGMVLALAILQLVTIGLLFSLKADIKHRVRKFGEFKAPIHRHHVRDSKHPKYHYDDENNRHEHENFEQNPELEIPGSQLPDPDTQLQ